MRHKKSFEKNQTLPKSCRQYVSELGCDPSHVALESVHLATWLLLLPPGASQLSTGHSPLYPASQVAMHSPLVPVVGLT